MSFTATRSFYTVGLSDLRPGARNVADPSADAGAAALTRYLALLRDFALGTAPRAHLPPAAEDDRLGALLHESLAELDPADRRLVAAKYLDGATIREIAAHAGLTEKAVESRLLRLRRELRERVLHKLSSP